MRRYFLGGISVASLLGGLAGCVTVTDVDPVSVGGVLYPTRVVEIDNAPVGGSRTEFGEVLIDGVWVRCSTSNCEATTRAVLERLNRVDPESDEPQEPDLLTPPDEPQEPQEPDLLTPPPEEPQEPDLLTPPPPGPPGSEQDAFGD